MAVKSNIGRVGGRVGVTVGKPVFSTDIMGNKTVEVRPVGAWVQPEADMTGYEHHHGVVMSTIPRLCIDQQVMSKHESVQQQLIMLCLNI